MAVFNKKAILKCLGWLAGSAAVMLLLPWAAVTFVSSHAGMTVTLLLFFVINPIYAVVAGVFAGKNIKRLWIVPFIVAILFLLGTWIFFDMGEGAFVIYADVYLVIGIVSMFVSSRIHAKKHR